MRIRRFLLLPLLAVIGFAISGTAAAATLTVTTTSDAGLGSLRAAVSSAEAGDTITFAANVNGTITLTTGEIAIAKRLTIQGPGADKLTISSNRQSRAFHLTGVAEVSISGLTIANCSSGNANGGAIQNFNATLVLNSCALTGNAAAGGGAISNISQDGTASLTIINSTISGNTAAGGGGGVSNLAFINSNAVVTIINSTFSENAATRTDTFGFADGGAIINQSNSGNATIRITHSTFWGNYASSPTSSYFGDTITNKNHAGGVPKVEMDHSIFQSNGRYRVIANSGGVISSLGYNICSDAANGDASTSPGGYFNATGDRRNTDARVVPLTDNGGPTLTHALYPESPAIDAGDPDFDPNVLGAILTTDQRGPGYSRVLKGTHGAISAVVDIGASEHFPKPVFTLTDSRIITTSKSAPYDLASVSGVQPAGGIFSGPGVIDGMFNPAAAGVGTYTITYTVTDGSNTAASTFEIVVSPPPSPIGIYNGLVRSTPGTNPSNERTGLIRISTNRNTGRFTGLLWLAGTRYSFKGAFDETGAARFGNASTPTVILKRRDLPDLHLSLQLTPGRPDNDQLTGALSEEGNVFATISADRALYTSKRNPVPPLMSVPAELLGRYTVIFAPKTPEQQGIPAANYPQGYGIGVLTVSANGTARLAGTLADGTPIAYANSLTRENSWPLYAAIGGNKGSISGLATFRDTTDVSDLDGLHLQWFKAGKPTATHYPEAWPDGIKVDLLGSKFVLPPKRSNESPLPGLDAVTPEGNAEIHLSSGELPSPGGIKVLNITSKGKVSVIVPAADKLSLSLRAPLIHKGIFSGSVTLPVTFPITGFQARLRGVIFQKQNAGFGYFLGKSESGSVMLAPK